jgi:hypothetical protein
LKNERLVSRLPLVDEFLAALHRDRSPSGRNVVNFLASTLLSAD